MAALNMEINAGLVDSKLKARMAVFGGTPLVLSPAEFGQRSGWEYRYRPGRSREA
jgi:hypothetical protein